MEFKQEESIGLVKLDQINNPILKEMVDVGLITKQGRRIQGMGLLISKMATNNEFVDKKVGMKLSFIEKKMEQIMQKMDIKLVFGLAAITQAMKPLGGTAKRKDRKGGNNRKRTRGRKK